MPDMTPEQAHWFRAGIEAAARLHDRLAEWAYEAEEDPKCGQMHRDFAERIRAISPAAPEPTGPIVWTEQETDADERCRNGWRERARAALAAMGRA